MDAPVLERLALAEHLLGIGQVERAEGVLDQVASEAIGLEAFWLLRAEAASARDDGPATIRAAEAGLARFPQSVPLLVSLGRAHAGAGRLAEAERALLAALQQDPEDVAALCLYAHTVALAGQIDKARRLLDRAAALEPESTRVIAARYQVAHLAGDDAACERLAAELARRTEGDPHALALLGIEAAKRARIHASRELLTRAARGDVRVVDALGADAFRALRAATHPLMWPLWPVQRFGPGAVWIAGIGAFVLIRMLAPDEVALGFAVVWIAYCVYSWVIPPLVRRLGR